MTYKKVTYIYTVTFNESFEESRIKEFMIDVGKTIRMFLDFRGIFFKASLRRSVHDADSDSVKAVLLDGED